MSTRTIFSPSPIPLGAFVDRYDNCGNSSASFGNGPSYGQHVYFVPPQKTECEGCGAPLHYHECECSYCGRATS